VSASHVDFVDQRSTASLRLTQRPRRSHMALNSNHYHGSITKAADHCYVHLVRSQHLISRFVLRFSLANSQTHVVSLNSHTTHISPSRAVTDSSKISLTAWRSAVAYRWRRKSAKDQPSEQTKADTPLWKVHTRHVQKAYTPSKRP